jgi:tape measure domain-containing protein
MNHILQYEINLKDGGFGRVMQNAEAKTQSLDNMLKRVGATLLAGYGIDRLKDYGTEAVMTSGKLQTLDNVIKFGSKNTEDYAANTQFLNKIIKDLNLPIEETTQGFSQLMGAMKGTQNQGKNARDIFQGINEAGAALHLTKQQFYEITLALQQMQSKGKVMAQELTLQLGNAIPGAQKLAADSMGVTTAALMKMMEKGEVLANDFLPKFGRHLHQVFGDQAKIASEAFTSQMQKNDNSMWRISATIGQKLQPAYLQMQERQIQIAQYGIKLVDFFTEHEKGIKAVAVGVGLLVAAYAAVNTVQKINGMLTVANILGNKAYVASELGAALGANILERSIIALNVSMAANPAVWIAGGIAVLAAGMYYFSKKAEDAAHIQDKFSSALYNTKSSMNAEISILKQANLTHDVRKKLIGEINTKYGEYLPHLISEKNSIKEIGDLQVAANNALERKIDLQAKEGILGEKMKAIVGVQKSIFEMEMDMAKRVGDISEANSPDLKNATEKRISIFKEALSGMLSDYEKISGKFGLKSTVNQNNKTEKIDNQTLSSSKSVRNVIVNIGSLVKELKVIMEGGLEKGTNAQDLKKQITQLLVGVVRDSEIALG